MLSFALTETLVVPVVENFADGHHEHGRLRFAVLILHHISSITASVTHQSSLSAISMFITSPRELSIFTQIGQN